ncbi:hypothetical protein OG529_04460 [Streptomyces longwoodensis]|uniref:hypothetical protein n=1 Tax=Streptomyces longwoodensis TaxID=68231 RepID=UPI0032482C54
MGDTDRPIPERLGDQEEQAAHLVRTGNGPTVDNEQQLLAEQFGPADMSGYFTGPERVDAAPAAEDDGDNGDQAAAADSSETPKGGASA